MKPEVSARRRTAKYQQLPHTADLAWRIRGDSLPELFENAAEALVATMTDRRYLRRLEKREIAVESPDREALLVDWLNYLLYLFDVEGFLGREFQVTALTDERLRATAWGEVFDSERHPEKTAIKAATYHHLEIVPRGDGWQATVILD
ncbi:MAG: archease, partial [Deltaproteobacteria bacterium]|nr:archease [Deltaproteobacteria bacterium]